MRELNNKKNISAKKESKATKSKTTKATTTGESGEPRKGAGATGKGTGMASTRSGTDAKPSLVVGKIPDASTGSTSTGSTSTGSTSTGSTSTGTTSTGSTSTGTTSTGSTSTGTVSRRRPRAPQPTRSRSGGSDGSNRQGRAKSGGISELTDGRVHEPSFAWAAVPEEVVVNRDLDALFDGVAEVPAWRRAFLVGLAHSGNVSLVCRTIGISRQAYYRTLELDETLESEVDSAMRAFGDRLVAEAVRRAVVGVPRYVVSQGRVVEVDGKPLQQLEYSDLLLDRLLKAHVPELFRERYDLNHSGDIPMKVYLGMDMDEL